MKRVKIEKKTRSSYARKLKQRRSNLPVAVTRPLSVVPETKFHQSYIQIAPATGAKLGDGSGTTAGTNAGNVGIVVLLNNLLQGGADGQRIGKKVVFKSMTYSWTTDPATGGSPGIDCKFQWGICQQTKSNAGYMVIADCFDNVNINAMVKPDHLQMFLIKDRYYHHFSSAALDANEFNRDKQGNGWLKWGRQKGSKETGIQTLYYNTNNGDQRDINENALWLYLITDVTNCNQYFNFNYRLKYIDV